MLVKRRRESLRLHEALCRIECRPAKRHEVTLRGPNERLNTTTLLLVDDAGGMTHDHAEVAVSRAIGVDEQDAGHGFGQSNAQISGEAASLAPASSAPEK